jgi:hypothetical protein
MRSCGLSPCVACGGDGRRLQKHRHAVSEQARIKDAANVGLTAAIIRPPHVAAPAWKSISSAWE